MMSKGFMGITIDPHVSVGHIFTTIAAIVAGTWAYASMEYRVKSLEQADARMEKLIIEQKSEYKYTLDRIYVQLEKINDKLDNKADK